MTPRRFVAPPFDSRPTGDTGGHKITSADTTILKFVAIILIANSHMEILYPRPWMAGDGLLGMAWFFAAAGFGLTLSERVRRLSFGTWYWRRVVRIYPALLLTVLAADVIIAGGWRYWTLPDYGRRMIWPTYFTFVALVMPAYIAFFLFMKVRDGKAYLVGIAVLAAMQLYFWSADLGVYTGRVRLSSEYDPRIGWTFHFQMMLLGGWRATRVSGAPRHVQPAASIRDLAALTLLFVCYVAAKYLMVVRGRLAWAYPALYLFAPAIGVYLFRLSHSRQFLNFVREPRRMAAPWRAMSAAVTFVGGLTLEIYLVHEYVMRSPAIRSLRFPLNIATFWPLTLVLAFVTSRAVAPVVHWLQRWPALRTAEGSETTRNPGR